MYCVFIGTYTQLPICKGTPWNSQVWNRAQKSPTQIVKGENLLKVWVVKARSLRGSTSPGRVEHSHWSPAACPSCLPSAPKPFRSGLASHAQRWHSAQELRAQPGRRALPENRFAGAAGAFSSSLLPCSLICPPSIVPFLPSSCPQFLPISLL